MVLKLYIDPMSQPARALMLFVRVNKIPSEEIIVSFMKWEHKNPEYAKVNRFQKVPAIIHGDFHLAESAAILRYLARAFVVPDHWYPSDLQIQARVDEFISWHHIGLRLPILNHFLAHLIPERLAPYKPATTEDFENYKTKMVMALNEIEEKWLGRNDFIVSDDISIADLIAVGEIEMTRLTNFDACAGRPKLTVYLEKVKNAIGAQIYNEVHTPVYEFQQSAKNKN